MEGETSRRKMNLFLIFLLVLEIFDPASAQFRRRSRYRLLPSLNSDEIREGSSGTLLGKTDGTTTTSTTPTPTPSMGIKVTPRKITLDPETGLNLTYAVNRNLDSISLTIESNNKSGYVALALSKDGKLKGADVIILGVRDEAIPYVIDMYGRDRDTVIQDDSQDWRLDVEDSTSVEKGMRVSVRRTLDSCDDQDMAIGEEKISLAFDQGDQDPTQVSPKGTREISFVEADPELGKLTSKCLGNPSSAVADSRSSKVKSGATELENITQENQDPAQDRYYTGIGAQIKVFPFFHSLAYARIKWKVLVSKLKSHKYFKKFYIKY